MREIEERIRKENQNLERMRLRLKEQQDKVKVVREREGSILTQLEEMNHTLRIQEKELKVYDLNLERNLRRSEEIGQELKEAEVALQSVRTLLGKRLRAIYKAGDLSYLRAIFSASDLTDLIRQIRFMRKIAEYDQSLILEFERKKEELKGLRVALEVTREAILFYREKALAKKQEVEEQKKRQQKLLNAIRIERASYERVERELKKAANELSSFIITLEGKREEALKNGESKRESSPATIEKGGKFSEKKGKLPWPVIGPVISLYGKVKDPRFSTFTFRTGIDIRAPSGTGVKAVSGGKVLFSDWFKGYGHLMIIDHEESYYSLYAYVVDPLVEVGDRVKAGQTIARVGESVKGSLLYFEIRHRGISENPLAWLQERN